MSRLMVVPVSMMSLHDDTSGYVSSASGPTTCFTTRWMICSLRSLESDECDFGVDR